MIMVRHGRTQANTEGLLAGWQPGVFLDDEGAIQARSVAERLSSIALSAVIASPLDRTQQTADAICALQPVGLPRHVDEAFGEVEYGDWTGSRLDRLAQDPLWPIVQAHPSSVTFPGGESMAAMQHRAVAAIRRWNALLGDDAVYAVVSHGDVIKAMLADALGLHLDHFQRIAVDPCSVSIVRYTAHRPFVLRMNDAGDRLPSFVRTDSASTADADAPVGGGAG